MVMALFNYIADLLFCYCTEEPDMRRSDCFTPNPTPHTRTRTHAPIFSHTHMHIHTHKRLVHIHAANERTHPPTHTHTRYGSREGMVMALFNYVADLLFCYCTEEPDMRIIYGENRVREWTSPVAAVSSEHVTGAKTKKIE